MQSSTNHLERRTAAFDALTALVAQWRTDERTTTTAGLTSALIRQGDLSLPELALDSNKAFWDAAVEAGVVVRTRLANGHWYVTLPGEPLPEHSDYPPTTGPAAVPAPDQPAPDGSTAATGTGRPPAAPARHADLRLRRDLWTAFVDWDNNYRRFWDRRHSRAFMTPVAPGWAPDVIDPTHYIEVPPALQDTQLQWMKSFADRQRPDATQPLLEALAADAPRGEFRRRLDTLGLHRAWRAELAERITTLAAAWAADAGLDPEAIYETRTRPASPDRTMTGTPRPAQPAGPAHLTADTSAYTHPSSRAAHGRLDPTDRLRARLHRIIDKMTWNDLADLPVRAEYLLEP